MLKIWVKFGTFLRCWICAMNELLLVAHIDMRQITAKVEYFYRWHIELQPRLKIQVKNTTLVHLYYHHINMCPKKILLVVDINTWQINAKAEYFYWQQITTKVQYFHPRISAKSFCRKVKKIQMGVLFIHAHEQ
jgi:hypothetical protein